NARRRNCRIITRLARAFFLPEDDRELVAADARDKIVLTATLSHQRGRLAKNFIAHAVAVLVVVFLEVVDVEKQQRHAEAPDSRFLKDLPEEGVEETPVVQTSQLIGDRKLLHAVVTVAKRGGFAQEHR